MMHKLSLANYLLQIFVPRYTHLLVVGSTSVHSLFSDHLSVLSPLIAKLLFVHHFSILFEVIRPF